MGIQRFFMCSAELAEGSDAGHGRAVICKVIRRERFVSITDIAEINTYFASGHIGEAD